MILKIISLVITLYSNILIVFIQNKQTVMFSMRAHQNLKKSAELLIITVITINLGLIRRITTSMKKAVIQSVICW